MKAILFAAVALTIPAAVNAAEFAHPDAAAISMQGVGTAQVCHLSSSYPTPVWACYNRTLFGAQNPVIVVLPSPGAVRVAGDVRWAYSQAECVAETLTLEGEVSAPEVSAELLASGLYGVCPGWVPMVPAQ